MAKANTYIKDIRAQVKVNHGGKVPEYLNLTIRQYAKALELKDHYEEIVMKEGAVIVEPNTQMIPIRKQHPLCNLIYQQESICQKYAKDLGLTAAKAAAKPESQGNREAGNKLDEFLDATMG